MSLTTVHDLEQIQADQDALLSAERDQLLEDLRRGIAPLVCLSGPGEPRRVVRITDAEQVTSKRSPWGRVAR
jgi:hypothetical protein